MGNIVFNQAAKFLSKRRNTRRWLAAVLCLALVVTSGTFGMLTRHGSALSDTKVLDCAFEVHHHSDECYDEDGNLVCGYADYCVHKHDASCYDSEKNLVCQLPEIEAHVHDDSCFEEEKCLICELEETEGHQHTEECYDIELGELTCMIPEHVHDDSCYELIVENEDISEDGNAASEEAPEQSEGAATGEAPVQSEEATTGEAPVQNEGTAAGEAPVQNEGTAAAETPIQNQEAPAAEAPAESEAAPVSEPAPQTEEPAADGEVASAAGLNKCAENRRLTCTMEEHTHSNDCYNQTKVLKCEKEEGSEPHIHTEECYEIKKVAKCGQLELHTHSDACYTDGKLTCGQLELVEHIHGEECFKDAPVTELTAQVDNVTITVSASQEGIIPAGAELSVTPVVKTETEILETLEDENRKAEAEALNAMYDEILQGLETSMEDDEAREIKDFLAYDISFYKENENNQMEEVQLEGQVNVKLEFAQDTLPEEIASNQDVQIENVDVFDVKATQEGLTAQVQQDAVVDTAQNAEEGSIPVQDAGVRKVETTLSDSSTIAIAWIGGIDPETGEYVYEDDDVIIKVSALAEGAIPENAKLQVIPIIASEETGEQYQQVADKLLEQAENKEYEIAGFLAYDISFIDEEGNKVEPTGEVKVSMNYKEAKIPAEVDAAAYAFAAEEETSEEETAAEPELNVKVMHLEENSEGSVNVVDMAEENKVTALETTDEQKIQNAEFVTGGFSVFTITWTWDTSTPYVYEDDQVKITITAIDKDAIPKETSLAITPIKADDEETAEQYQEVARKLMEKAAGESYDIEGFLAYDISLIGEDGAEIEPDGKVKVTMEYKQPMAVVEIDPETYALVKEDSADAEKGTPVEQDASEAEVPQDEMEADGNDEALPEEISTVDMDAEFGARSMAGDSELPEAEKTDSSEAAAEADSTEKSSGGVTMTVEPGSIVTVMHLEEDADGEVTQVVDLQDEDNVKTVETTEAQEVQKLEFVTESFSTYTVTWMDPSGSEKDKKIILWDQQKGEEINPKDNIQFEVSTDPTLLQYTIVEGNSLYEITAENNDIYTYMGAVVIIGDGTPSEDLSENTLLQGFMVTNGKLSYLDGNIKEDADNVHYYFMYKKQQNIDLRQVETIDHTESGIVMRMIDHTDARGEQPPVKGSGNGANGLMPVEDWEKTSGAFGKVQQNLVKRTLNSNGYPVYRNDTNLDPLFSEDNANARPVNYLFLKNTYDTTGYYEYSSFENYAYLQRDNNFKVYENLGTPIMPEDTGVGKAYQRGNFLPYNDISSSNVAQYITNQYDEYGVQLEEYDKDGNKTRLNEPLHYVQDPNYYFGMYMEAKFSQPADGLVEHNGNIKPMVYEFNGDDDLWVFIDGVLVLDIGGVHDACAGRIDFATGEVKLTTTDTDVIPTSGIVATTTIKEMYREAEVFPDGTPWKKYASGEEAERNAQKEKELFDGNTFADYTTHTIKMFYMERGAGASDLHIKMNIPTIPQGTIEVEKQLTNTDKDKYKEVEFSFQVYVQEIKGKDDYGNETYYDDKYVPLKTGEGGNVNVDGDENGIKAVDEDGNLISTFTTDGNGTFKLKQGECIRFSGLQNNRKYYVVETGVSSEKYDRVTIRSTTVESVDAEGKTEQTYEAKSAEATVVDRPHITYLNNCSAANSRELRIKKQMSGDAASKDTFTFRVTLGESILYTGPYYLQDKDGKYLYYEDQKLTSSDDAHVYGNAVDGVISGVPVDCTVTITQIMSETKFTVEEIELSEKYDTPKYELEFVAIGQNATEGNGTIFNGGKVTSEMQLSKNAVITVTNSYKSNHSWELVKTSSTKGDGGTKVLLSGAVFELVEVTEKENKWVEAENANKYTGTSQEDDKSTDVNETGIVTWVDKDGQTVAPIPTGNYKLKEKTSPVGYSLSSTEWLLEVTNDGKVTISKLGDKGTKGDVVNAGKTEGDKEIFYFENTPAYALPSTGGEGVYWYSIGGTLLMMAGALILYKNKTKRVRGCRRA